MVNPTWSVSSIPLVAVLVIVLALVFESTAAEYRGRELNQYEEKLVLGSLRDEEGRHLCSATPIAPDAVLTAARCFDSLNTGASTQVHLKRLSKQGWDHSSAEMIPSDRTVIHPYYNPANFDNDVAIVFLKWKTSLLTYPLEASDQCFESGEGCAARLLDWGDDSSVVTLGGVSRERCRSLLPFTITENMVCAENLQPAICAGDHGAPLLVGGKVVGIASTSFGCGRRGNPEVFTSIPAVKWWIEDQLGGEERQEKESHSSDEAAWVKEAIGKPSSDDEWADEGDQQSTESEPAPSPSFSPPPPTSPSPPPPPPPSPPPPPPPPPSPPPSPPPPPPPPPPKQSNFVQPPPAQITNALRNAIFSGDVDGAADILSSSSDVNALASGLRFSGRRRLFGF